MARPEPEWEVIGRYAGAEEMGKGLDITVKEAKSVIDGGGRFIPLENGLNDSWAKGGGKYG